MNNKCDFLTRRRDLAKHWEGKYEWKILSSNSRNVPVYA